MITDAQYAAWLIADNKERVVLCEADYLGGTEYFSDRGYVSGPFDTPANIAYDDLLATIPEIRSRIDASAAVGSIEVLNTGGDLDDWLTRAWAGRSIRLYFGDSSWSRNDFRQIFQGVISEISAPQIHLLGFAIADKAESLKVPVSETLYTGASHPAKGQGLPRVYGTVFNVSPVLIDAATRKYQVSDLPLSAITAVRAGGVSKAFTAQLSAGTFTLTSATDGTVTCDAASSITTASGIINDIVTRAGSIASSEIDSVSFAAFPLANVGLYIQDTAERDIDECLDELTATFGGSWRFDRAGLLKLHRLAVPSAATHDFIDDDIRQHDNGESSLRLTATESPAWRHVIGYRKNWTVQGSITDEKPSRKDFYRPLLTIFGLLTAQRGRAFAEAYRDRVHARWAARAELAPTVADAERNTYGDDYLRVTAESASIKTTWPKAEDRELSGTLLVSELDAQAEADRRLTLRSTVRRIFSMDMTTAPFSVDVGDEILLTHPRYGFASGVPALVTGIAEQPTKGFVSLDIWV